MEFSALDLTFDVCIMSALLVLGKIIRTRVPLLQNLFIPSALIAGFMGIILGPFCLNWVPLSSQASSYAGILIAVLFATLYLGRRSQGSFKEMFRQVGDTFMLNGAAEILQYGIALILGGILIATVFQGVTEWFPILMPGGFVGGHGTAAAIGSVFEEGGWAEATTVGQTFATFGLLGGIISGIVAINYCANKGWTTEIRKVKDMPEEVRVGLVPEKDRTPMGENTVNPMSIDPLAWHVALVMVAVGGAYLINAGLKILFPQVSVPVYGIALLVGVVLFALLKLIKLDSYVDQRVVSRIGSCATDYLVAFGVATININVVHAVLGDHPRAVPSRLRAGGHLLLLHLPASLLRSLGRARHLHLGLVNGCHEHCRAAAARCRPRVPHDSVGRFRIRLDLRIVHRHRPRDIPAHVRHAGSRRCRRHRLLPHCGRPCSSPPPSSTAGETIRASRSSPRARRPKPPRPYQ